MKTEQRCSAAPIIAGVLITIFAAIRLWNVALAGFLPLPLLLTGAYVLLALLLFMQKRNMLMAIPIAIIMLFDLRQLVSHVSKITYHAVDRTRMVMITAEAVSIIGLLILLSLIAIATINGLSRFREKAKGFWFLPFSLVVVSELIFLTSFPIYFIAIALGLMTAGTYALMGLWFCQPNILQIGQKK